MDNTKKRKIVRNFVIGYLIIQVLTIVVYLGFWSLHPEGITNVTNERMSPPPIFPDYKGTTIPYNIAPLNFRINVPADECYAKIEGSESEVFEYHGTNTIRFKMKDWILRAANGGTYIVQDKKISKLNTKTNGTISNMTYPFWHPSGRYITTSVNDIKQFFHSVKEKKMEVFDLESDVVVYDVKNKEILSKASLITKDAFETFPAFSPDGKWLYFCTAPAQKMPENYDKVRYNLCRVAFDPDRGEISFPIDTLVHADSLSYTFPRISPDGRFLMYTETAYGQFPIWHPDAEIRMMDLENRTAMDMSALNSPDTDSYHSWSSNSDWVVFSSRRDNGLYTLPYICYIGKDGKPSKPFLLPQEDPDKYDYQLYSYNIPELTKGAVEVSPYEIQQVAEKNKPEQVRFK